MDTATTDSGAPSTNLSFHATCQVQKVEEVYLKALTTKILTEPTILRITRAQSNQTQPTVKDVHAHVGNVYQFITSMTNALNLRTTLYS